MLPLLLALLGCSYGDRVTCASDEQVLAESGGDQLTCGEAEVAITYVELLAARPMGRQRGPALAAVRDVFERDPVEARTWLEDLAEARLVLVEDTGFAGAEARSHAVYAYTKGEGPIPEDYGKLRSAADVTLAVWNTHDEDQLALTEADIEAWIRYGSLCREVQGAGVLRISVADRVGVYSTIGDRWNFGTKLDRVALASLGPYWPHVQDNWQAASYEKQQAWAAAAPLPPPMTATSLGYLQAILEGDLPGHASSIHGKLGPLRMAR